jgi:hypothetical protein
MALGLFQGIPANPLRGFANQYSTLFDGSNDYMDCGNSATLNPADITISAWIKPTALTSWDYLVTRGAGHYNKAYRFEVGATQLFCAFGNGSTNVSIAANHGMSNGNWYHVAVTFDGANAALYVDGASIGYGGIGTLVMDTSAETTYICYPVTSNPYFAGAVDEVAIFSSVLSGADITAIYGGGVPGDLRSYSPVAWWRMGDSNAGAGTLIYDEVDKSIGDELITNGTFASDTGWTKGTGWTISAGVASNDGSGAPSDMYQTPALDTSNTLYEVTFTVSGYSSGSMRCVVGGSGVGAYRTANGTYTEQIRVISGPNFYLQSNSFVGSVDNVSVKQINGNPGILRNSPVIGTDIPAAS